MITICNFLVHLMKAPKHVFLLLEVVVVVATNHVVVATNHVVVVGSIAGLGTTVTKIAAVVRHVAVDYPVS